MSLQLSLVVVVNPMNELKKKIINNIEFIISPLIGLLICYIFHAISVYDNYSSFEIIFQNLCLNIGTALISFIGIILTGVALVISMLNKDIVKTIEKYNYVGVLKPILNSFKYLAVHSGIQIIIMYSLYIILQSSTTLINIKYFYVISFCIISYFSFLILYIIGIVKNCISLFFITNVYSSIFEEQKKIDADINLIVLEYTNQITKYPRKDFLEGLENYINQRVTNEVTKKLLIDRIKEIL